LLTLLARLLVSPSLLIRHTCKQRVLESNGPHTILGPPLFVILLQQYVKNAQVRPDVSGAQLLLIHKILEEVAHYVLRDAFVQCVGWVDGNVIPATLHPRCIKQGMLWKAPQLILKVPVEFFVPRAATLEARLSATPMLQSSFVAVPI
jgi:hypothetical protein